MSFRDDDRGEPSPIVITEEDLDKVPGALHQRDRNLTKAGRLKHLFSAIVIGVFIVCTYGTLILGSDSEAFFLALLAIVGYGFWTVCRSKFARYSQSCLTKLSGTSSGCINIAFAFSTIGIVAPFVDLINHLLQFIFYKGDEMDEDNTR